MDKLLNQTIDQVHFDIYSQEKNLLPALEFKPMTILPELPFIFLTLVASALGFLAKVTKTTTIVNSNTTHPITKV